MSDSSHYIVGSIIVTPAVPAAAIEGTSFGVVDNTVPDRQLCLIGADGDQSAGFSIIQGASPHGTSDPFDVSGELAELLELLGDGYSYSGALVIDGGDVDSTFRLRVVRRHAAGDAPAYWGVAEDDAALTFPADRGPLTAALGNDDVECALRTLAQLDVNGLEDPHDVLSARQKTLARRLANLMAAEAKERAQP